jgi:putative ABC transport system permease protein
MLKQISAITAMNLRNVPQRWGISLVIVIGIAVAVAVLVSVLAMKIGFDETLSNTGRPDRAIVLRGGSDAELNSTISRENTLTILDAPGVKKSADGKSIGSADVVAIVNLPLKSTGTDANVVLRGVGPKELELHPEIHLIAGRMFQPALREVIVGRSAQGQFKGLDVGSHVAFRDAEWIVVGVYESNGDAHESEMMADVETVLSAFRRNLFQSVTVMLDSEKDFDKFSDSLTTNPTLSVEVKREPAYYATQSKQLNKVLNFIATFVGGIMALGAVFGTINTMYSAVAARMLEIATLRAIGFGAFPVVISVLVEAMLVAIAGGAIGAATAWVLFNGNVVNTLGANFSQVVFHLTVSVALLIQGMVWACAIGFTGGIFPAIRAARAPVAEALRAG